MAEPQRDPARASRFTTRGRNLKSLWAGIFCNEKKKRRNPSKREAGRKQIKEKCSVCFPLGEGIWRSHSSLSSLCFESCIGSWLGRAAGHTERVIRTAIGIPEATRFTSPLHKSASHTKETRVQKLHTKPKHVADCSMQASPDRDTETASLSLPPTYDMNSTQGHCSTHTTAAAEPLSPAAGRPTLLGNQPALTDHQLRVFYTSWQEEEPGSQVTGKRTRSEDRERNMSEERCWE